MVNPLPLEAGAVQRTVALPCAAMMLTWRGTVGTRWVLPPHPGTALQTLRRPLVATFPDSAGTTSTAPRIRARSAAREMAGSAVVTRTAAPETIGVAIEVPSKPQ